VTFESLEDGELARVSGEVNASVSSTLRGTLMEAVERGPSRLVVDLGDVPFMDSAGVAVLVEVLRAQREAGRELALRHLQERVRGMFEIARLDSLFPIESGENGGG
jgi:anti-sigma B factor antagonist